VSQSPTDNSEYHSLFTFDEALGKSPVRPLVKPLEEWVAQGCVLGFIVLATILGALEMPFTSVETYRAIVGIGAPVGMKQGWRLFGPQLRTYNWHTLVLIEFADGSLKAQEMPRMDKLPLLERFMKEKERSVLGDRIAFVKFSRFWPSVARFYARANFDSQNLPRKVTFIFASAPLPPPDVKNWTFRDCMPEHTQRQVYFVYRVTPADFENCGKGFLK
jgi:hypothetical protein